MLHVVSSANINDDCITRASPRRHDHRHDVPSGMISTCGVTGCFFSCMSLLSSFLFVIVDGLYCTVNYL
jgi:hypothetical protein